MTIIEELEEIRLATVGHAQGEVLSGNVVKEALYRGTAAGLLVAINLLRERALAQAVAADLAAEAMLAPPAPDPEPVGGGCGTSDFKDLTKDQGPS